jgi:hypothetical protein
MSRAESAGAIDRCRIDVLNFARSSSAVGNDK